MTIFLVNCLDCVKGEREGERGRERERDKPGVTHFNNA